MLPCVCLFAGLSLSLQVGVLPIRLDLGSRKQGYTMTQEFPVVFLTLKKISSELET